jgi:hypothetical protein
MDVHTYSFVLQLRHAAHAAQLAVIRALRGYLAMTRLAPPTPAPGTGDAAARQVRHGAHHEYVCKKCFAAETPAYHAITPPKTSVAHLPTVVADESAGNPANKIDGDTPLWEGSTWF